MDVINLKEATQVKIEAGEVSFMADPWELSETLEEMLVAGVKAGVNWKDYRLQVSSYIKTTYNVDLSESYVEALRHLLPAAIKKKKEKWLADFNSTAS